MIVRALAVCSLLLAAGASSAAPDFDYAAPHQRIDIGGRKLNLFCAGEGAPTVLFESAGGTAAWNWFMVHPKVTAHSRACVYDRAGFGFSDPSGRPGDSENEVADLHALLKAANLPAPYLLVASSYGAMDAQLYTYRFPAEVAGLVLVDGQSEDEEGMFDAMTGGMFTKMAQQGLAGYDACGKQAAGGQIAEQCAGESGKGSDPALAAAIEKERRSPQFWQARESESASFLDASSRELRESRHPFGKIPVLILARTVSPYLIPGQPQSDMNKAGEVVHRKSLDAIAALASGSEIREIPNASHLIQLDQPDAVSDAVIEMVKRLR